MIVYVLANQPTEMFLIQRDDMVQDLAPATSHPSFRQPILPGRPDACSFGLQTRRLQKGDHLIVEFRISIQDHVAIRRRLGEHFAQLLYNPGCRRTSGNVEVQDPATSVLDDEEAVEEPESQRRHGEEVERSDHLPVIGEEGQPTLAWITAVLDTLQITGYGSFGNDEAQFLEFSMDPGRPPGRILFG